jgi:anti-sigma factor RsiW
MTSPHDPPPPDLGCEAARADGRAFRRGQLPDDARLVVADHLVSCAACRRLFAAESTWDTALDEHLPRFAAPASLKSRLATSWGLAPRDEASVASPPGATSSPSSTMVGSPSSSTASARAAFGPRRNAWRSAGAWLGGACLGSLLVGAAVKWSGSSQPQTIAESTLITEAVNDHLRVIQSSHPVEIESGGIHQVKPWFTGKLDFAPGVAFSGDTDFPLVGGSVGYFINRKAAVLTFKHHLHVLTLLIVPRQGLPWPAETTTTSRGFHLRFWQKDDLGFTLVSDASVETLAALARHIDSP